MDRVPDLTEPMLLDATSVPDEADHLHGIRRQFEEVLGGERSPAVPAAPVDVSTYLLDPPLTEQQRALQARRRLYVRRGSLAGAGVLAVVLLAPMPGQGQDPAASEPASVATTEPAPVLALPEPDSVSDGSDNAVRVDQPATARATRPRRRARHATPRRETPPRPAAAATPAPQPSRTPPPAAPATAPAPKPAAASPPKPAPAPTPAPDAAILVPVM